MRLHLLFVCGLIFLLSGNISAQQKYGGITGVVLGKKAGDRQSIPLNMCNIKICTASDTTTTVLPQSTFFFNKIPVGKVKLEFSYLGYKSNACEIEIEENKIRELAITMIVDVINIGEVIVKSKIPLFTVQNDTIIFNAAAIKTLEGDETIEILKQMPGVLMSGGRISVMGKDIELTYIDDKLIFGRDPMAALNNLLASDVITIRAYDEPVNKAAGTGHPGEETRRVLNIETKSKLVAAIVGHFLASYGHDIPGEGDQGRDRYGIGATANLFSEELLLSANAFFNNLNRSSNRIADLLERQRMGSSYNRSTYMRVGIERNWDTKEENEYENVFLYANYSYEDNYSNTNSRILRNYSPSINEGYNSRIEEIINNNRNQDKKHTSNIGFYHPQILKWQFNIRHSLSFSESDVATYNLNTNIIDHDDKTGLSSRSDITNNNYNLSEDISLIRRFKDGKIVLKTEIGFKTGEGDGRGLRIDSILSNGTQSVLKSSPVGNNKKFSGSFSLSNYFNKKTSISIDYKYNYEDYLAKQTVFDITDGIPGNMDETNTYDYTARNSAHSINASLSNYFDKFEIGMDLTVESTSVDLDERIPKNEPYNKNFNSLKPKIQIKTRGGAIMTMTKLTYEVDTRIPYVEQLRSRIDEKNKFNLTRGNPNLKQSYLHSISFSHNEMIAKNNSNLFIMADVYYTQNHITAARRFFLQDTPLSQYGSNVVVPAGSTLTTYENVSGLWRISTKASHRTLLKKIKCNFTITPGFGFEDIPSLREEQVIRSKRYFPSLSLNLMSNFSQTLRMTVGSETGYIFTKNNLSDRDEFLRESITATATVNNIFKLLVFNVNYNGTFYHRTSDLSTDNSHVLNLSLGCKLFKQMGELNVAVFDALNHTSGFSTLMNADYIENSWRQSFGRYFVVNFAIKFNKTRSSRNVSYKRQLNDGRV